MLGFETLHYSGTRTNKGVDGRNPVDHNVRAMALDAAFVDDCPYGPGGLLLDEILEVDAAAGRVRARMPTHSDLPLTREQRNHPERHPSHVSGGLIVHMTGMVGFVHAYYVLGLRHADGWIGYGGAIHKARFRALALPGEPIEIDCRSTRVRRGAARILARYELRFLQGDTLVYEGDQTALWMKVRVGDAAQGVKPAESRAREIWEQRTSTTIA